MPRVDATPKNSAVRINPEGLKRALQLLDKRSLRALRATTTNGKLLNRIIVRLNVRSNLALKAAKEALRAAKLALEAANLNLPHLEKQKMIRERRGTLSPAERRVYQLLLQGRSNKEIARLLHLSVSGAAYHVSNVLTTFDCRTRQKLLALHS